MSIADAVYFQKDHIRANKFDASDGLAEQAVHCLELVSQLVTAGLSFQFKGGNSLLLVTDAPRRFSIDVDIATNEPAQRIEQCLELLTGKHGVFTKWTKRQHKTKPWLPLASFYCFFRSHFIEQENAFIMLDAQLKRSPYATRFAAVRCGDLYASDVQAEIPLASSIIGDKLLTIGPQTLGIPLGKGKEAQRLKHVFDISLLLAARPSLDDVRKSLFACMEHENQLQEKSVTAKELLEDTVESCAVVKTYPLQPEFHEGMNRTLAEHVQGFEPFRRHLFCKDFNWEALKKDMARVALVMTAACMEGVDDTAFQSALENKSHNADYCWEMVGKWLSRQ